MKLLVIGCGSIGRRHARNARSLGMDVYLCDVNELRMSEFAREINASGCFTDFNEAIKSAKPEVAIVATPSNFHVEPARALLMAGIHVFMEKPLCTDVDEAISLRTIVRQTGLVFMMAHTYRFRAEWLEVKRILDTEPLGEVYSAEFMGGWYLPDWHIREDYRTEYAAQKSLGGGVLLTNLSHLFDVVAWFFGDIRKVTGSRMRLSKLDIDVDDSVMCHLLTSAGVAVTMHEDFLCRCPRRSLRINAEHGYLEADFNGKTLSLWDARQKRFHPDTQQTTIDKTHHFRILEDGVGYDLEPDRKSLEYSGNDAYLSELKCFLERVEAGHTQFDLDIEAGVKVLEALHHVGIKDWTDSKERLQ